MSRFAAYNGGPKGVPTNWRSAHSSHFGPMSRPSAAPSSFLTTPTAHARAHLVSAQPVRYASAQAFKPPRHLNKLVQSSKSFNKFSLNRFMADVEKASLDELEIKKGDLERADRTLQTSLNRIAMMRDSIDKRVLRSLPPQEDGPGVLRQLEGAFEERNERLPTQSETALVIIQLYKALIDKKISQARHDAVFKAFTSTYSADPTAPIKALMGEIYGQEKAHAVVEKKQKSLPTDGQKICAHNILRVLLGVGEINEEEFSKLYQKFLTTERVNPLGEFHKELLQKYPGLSNGRYTDMLLEGRTVSREFERV